MVAWHTIWFAFDFYLDMASINSHAKDHMGREAYLLPLPLPLNHITFLYSLGLKIFANMKVLNSYNTRVVYLT